VAETDRKRGSAGRFATDFALRRTGSFARKRLDRHLAPHGLAVEDIARIAQQKQGFGTRVAAALLVRLATRSVPGAVIVGGGLVARALLGRKRRRDDAE
jgi:hypothetical protein